MTEVFDNQLPTALEQRHAAMQGVVERALYYQGQINGTDAPAAAKLGEIARLKAYLNHRARGQFLGEVVELSGAYAIPEVVGKGREITTVSKQYYGTLRAISRGFDPITKVGQDKDGAYDTDMLQVRFQHVLEVSNPNQSPFARHVPLDKLHAFAYLDEASLELATVANYRRAYSTAQAVQVDGIDRRWSHRLDELIYAPQDINFRALGTLLSRLRGQHPERIDDYLRYLNFTLSEGSGRLRVIAGSAIRSCLDGTWTSHAAGELVEGKFECINFGEAADPGRQTKLDVSQPMLYLTKPIAAKEAAIHVPLGHIEQSEFVA